MTDPGSALLLRPERYPRSSRYDPAWVLAGDMGPHPLWQLEDLLDDLDLRAGDRVLDLGCGRGATSVFLAREFGVEVTAVDLWVTAAQLTAEFERSGVADRVTALQADARALPFAPDHFDAMVSIDAFEYFGTDTRFLPGLVPMIRSGGRIAMSTPALCPDPYSTDPPAVVTALLGAEVAAWHDPSWWQRHWQLSGMLDPVTARWQDGGRHDWLRWARACGEPPDSLLMIMLDAVSDDELGFALVSATVV